MKNSIPLWPYGTKQMRELSPSDVPTITPYLPTTAKITGAAMVICPGGGYRLLSPHEGKDYALWLNLQGITCFVLKYRLGSAGFHYPVQFQDVTRAIRWVRANAERFKIDPHRIGVMGSSAGGHLAATLLTRFDSGNAKATDIVERQSSRPDLGVLCYAVITMDKLTHQGSLKNLLGKTPKQKLVKLVSNEMHVTHSTPPCFLWTTFEDTVVPMENTMMFAKALLRRRVPFTLHVYEKGEHGMGLRDKPPFNNPHPWALDCLLWLKEKGF